jgi:hypothetical protein
MNHDVRHTNIANAGSFAPVPPVGRLPVSSVGTGGTVYPLIFRGSEFNALAPQMPERLIVTRFTVSRQHQLARAPPMLESIAHHG